MKRAREISQPVRVGLVGFGLAGSTFHAPIIESVDGLELAAIVTRRTNPRLLSGSFYPNARMYESPGDLWSDESIELVVIATPTITHCDLAVQALRSGKHVVVEKPLAPTVREAKAITEQARESERILSVYQNRRWDGDFMTVKRIVSSGVLGTIHSFESRVESYCPDADVNAWYERSDQAGGSLYSMGTHLIDQAVLLFGAVTHVYAELDRRRPAVEGDDMSLLALTFATGVRGRLYISDVTRIAGPRFRVAGSLGVFEKYGMDPQEEQVRSGARPGDADWGRDPRERWGRLVAETHGLLLDGVVETIAGAYEGFYVGIRDAVIGHGPIPADPADAIVTLGIVEAAMLSSERRQVVRLESGGASTSGAARRDA